MNVIPLIIIVIVAPLTLLKAYLLTKDVKQLSEENKELKRRLGR